MCHRSLFTRLCQSCSVTFTFTDAFAFLLLQLQSRFNSVKSGGVDSFVVLLQQNCSIFVNMRLPHRRC